MQFFEIRQTYLFLYIDSIKSIDVKTFYVTPKGEILHLSNKKMQIHYVSNTYRS